MFARKHLLVQNAADEDSCGFRPVNNNVPLVFQPAVPRLDSIASAADFRSLGDSIEASLQIV
jgi:hypothetical protein